MTIPNLVSLLILHREMRETIDDYWVQFDREYPGER